MNYRTIYGLLLVILIITLPVFAHLDQLPIQFWDEARQAVGAYEMLQNKNWLIPCFDNSPDMWNTKPPLMIWLQVLSMKMFGVNELAVRFPSAVAAVFTCLFLYWFSLKKLSNIWVGVLACFVLVTSEGYIRLHVTRTGDYDSLLTLFTTVYSLCFWLYLQEGKKKYFYITVFTLILAALTKGIAALLLAPGLLLYTVYDRKLLLLLKTREFYRGILLFVFIVTGYYLLREHYNPGYIKAVWENELGGRYMKVIEYHKESSAYYLKYLVTTNFKSWYLFLLLAIVLGFISKDLNVRKITVYFSVLIGTFYLVISTAQTKLDWYDAPLYPLMSIVVALAMINIARKISKSNNLNKYSKATLSSFFILACCVPAYLQILEKTLYPKQPEYLCANNDMAEYLKQALHNKRKINSYIFTWRAMEQNILWYVKIMGKTKGIRYLPPEGLFSGNIVVVYQDDTKQYIEDHYTTSRIEKYNNVIVYQINGVKN